MKINNKYLIYFNFFIVYSLLFYITIKYFQSGEIYQWDSIGHLYSSWYLKNNFFPFPLGWNADLFMGFPQGQFYPPLFHYLVALLAYLIPIEYSFKVIVLLSVFLTPLSFFFYGSYILKSKTKSSVAMVLMILILSSPISISSINNALGNTFKSTFEIGLVANALSLPLFFFYINSLHRKLAKEKYISPSLILSILLLTHIITFFAAALYSVIFFAVNVKNTRFIKNYLKHFLLTLGLTSWWLIPFFAFIKYFETIKIWTILGKSGFIFLIIGIFLSFYIYLNNKNYKLQKIPIIYFLFTTIAIFFSDFYNINIHSYRFIIFPILIIPILLVQIIKRKYLIFLSLISIIIILCAINFNWTDFSKNNINKNELTQVELNNINGRTLIASDDSIKRSPHYFHIALPMFANIEGLRGLFVESSLNSKYILSLEQLINKNSFVWGLYTFDLKYLDENIRKELINNHINNFGISNIIINKSVDYFDNYEKNYLFTHKKKNSAWLVDNFYEIPILEERVYLTQYKNYIIYVIQGNFETKFIIYKANKNIENTGNYILKSSDDIYFVNKQNSYLYDIKMSYNKYSQIQYDFKPLDNIEKFIKDFDIEKNKKDQITKEIFELRENSYKYNLDYFQTFTDIIDELQIEKIREKEIPNQDLIIKEVFLDNNFYLYSKPNEIIQILDYYPKVIEKDADWNLIMGYWFTSSESKNIIIQDNDKHIEFANNLESKSEINNIEIERETIKFKINSESKKPIIIKKSYFPKWKAYADGKEIPIYKASPNNIFIYANGNIEIRYVNQWYEFLAYIISILSILFILFIKYYKKNK